MPLFKIIIAVGSNIDPERNILHAENIIKKEQRFLGKSTFIKTKPVGYQAQKDFLNGAFLIESSLEYKELNAYLKEVEKRLGRKKGTIKSGPRTIDLDIILWDNKIVDNDFFSRDYIKTPVAEIIAEFKLEPVNFSAH